MQVDTTFPTTASSHLFGRVFAPFFMVTGKDGSYKIGGLPMGEYMIVAWHEKFGEQEVKVSVGAGETKNVDFTFKASEQ